MKKITAAQIDADIIKDCVLLYPTETVYGLGCSIYDTQSIKKIYALKGRPSQKKVITLVDSLKQAKSLALVSAEEEHLLSSGLALTLLLTAKDTSPEYLISENNLVSIRKTTHPICLELIQKLGAPLVSTSANISGEPAVTDLRMLPESLIESCDVIIDAGMLPSSEPSTIVQMIDGKPVIMRKGCVSEEKIVALIANKNP